MSGKRSKVEVRKEENLLWVTINRPEVKNAVDFDVADRLGEAVSQAESDPDISVMILQGKKGIFCSGGDLTKFHSLRTEEEALSMLRPVSRLLKRIADLPVITVAYLNGHAVGGGCEIAASCDYRLSLPGSRTGFIQGTLAITTGWGGASFLKEKVPYTTALTMLGSARLFSAEEGKKIRWINKIVESDEELRLWCSQWAHTGKEVIAAYKQTLRTEQERETLAASVDREVRRCAVLWEMDAHHEAVELFLSKRKRSTGGNGSKSR
ncbi:enoyl-CoA hydratase/isomerase family protein [Alteribacter natronophilus]|uniref:enoyl-CoA hydratase/isomerase family protein n=1 Tax=Alteribacter natronophilus TaxID=2583810 RepID=UPI00110D3AF4|nr:enoyl-CoA hydratase/isomerase family protein [Alteribacter natronophilus]TMW73111.1 enoyl-CoA hydratase/isomerase family protein [Alteribacter natronophilus]